MIGLTQRQLDALRFIAGYEQAKGNPPSYREIAKALGVESTSAVSKMVASLKERGAIAAMPHRKRAITVIAPVTIPRAPDGAPLYCVRVRP